MRRTFYYIEKLKFGKFDLISKKKEFNLRIKKRTNEKAKQKRVFVVLVEGFTGEQKIYLAAPTSNHIPQNIKKPLVCIQNIYLSVHV